MLTPAIAGFSIGFSLILAIGAQNAFVLRQGLMRAHVLPICLACALSDAILITAGVAGMARVAATAPWAPRALALAGAVFLTGYGALSLARAFRPESLRPAGPATGSLRRALATCLALTWLNPHVYLDTVALIGAVSAGFAPGLQRLAFGVGAVAASFVFFFTLGYGARLLAPVFARPRAWVVLDIAIALVMWFIAAGLYTSAWEG